MTTLYKATTNATGGREGHVLSEDGPIDMALYVPKSMGGDDGKGVNPEQLFGGAYAALFGGAFQAVVGIANLDRDGTQISVAATMGFGKEEDGGCIEER